MDNSPTSTPTTMPTSFRPTHKVLRIARRTVRPGTAESSVLGTEHEEEGSDDSHMSSYPYENLFFRGCPSPSSLVESKGRHNLRAESPPTFKSQQHPKVLARGRSALARCPPMTMNSNKVDDQDYLASFLDDMDMDYSNAVDIFSESYAESDSDDGEGNHALLNDFQERRLPGRAPLSSSVDQQYMKPLPRPPSPSLLTCPTTHKQGRNLSGADNVLDDLHSEEVSSNGDLTDVYALGWPDVPHTPVTPSTPTGTGSFLPPTIPHLRVGDFDLVANKFDNIDDEDVLTSTIRPRSSSLTLTSFLSSPALRSTGIKQRPALPFPHLLKTSTSEDLLRTDQYRSYQSSLSAAAEAEAAEANEPTTPTTFTSFLSTSSDGVSPVPFEFSDGSASTFASPSTSPSRSRNGSRACSSEQLREEKQRLQMRPLPPTPWVLIDRQGDDDEDLALEEERDNRTPTPGPGLFAAKYLNAHAHFDGESTMTNTTNYEQELDLPPSRFSLCSSAGIPCSSSSLSRRANINKKDASNSSSSSTTTTMTTRFGLATKVKKAVKMPSKSNLKLSSTSSFSTSTATNPSKEKKDKDRTRRISGISTRTAQTSRTNYTSNTAFTGISVAASSTTFQSIRSSKSASPSIGSRIKRLLGVSSSRTSALPPVPSLDLLPGASTSASRYASAHSTGSTSGEHLRSPVKNALNHLPSFQEKKRLVVRLLGSSEDAYDVGRLSPAQEERAFECIREWCSIYGPLKRITIKSPYHPTRLQSGGVSQSRVTAKKCAMEVHVHFKTRSIAERVFRSAGPTQHIPGAGYVELSYEGRR